MIEHKHIVQLKDIIKRRDEEIRELRKKLSQYEKDSRNKWVEING
jgi:inorganic pyrophosphatase|tara:strand:+ start:54 stop:188 length:135 start_codon:yes stop_codon:yes gene_type:complete